MSKTAIYGLQQDKHRDSILLGGLTMSKTNSLVRYIYLARPARRGTGKRPGGRDTLVTLTGETAQTFDFPAGTPASQESCHDHTACTFFLAAGRGEN